LVDEAPQGDDLRLATDPTSFTKLSFTHIWRCVSLAVRRSSVEIFDHVLSKNLKKALPFIEAC
jgi:hypothetical protein